jgi:hypothetical protein
MKNTAYIMLSALSPTFKIKIPALKQLTVRRNQIIYRTIEKKTPYKFTEYNYLT